MSKSYFSAVPLTMVRTIDGGYRNVLEGDQIAGEAVDPTDLKRLVRKEFLKEVQVEGDGDDSDKSDKVGDILSEVGDDKDKAAAAIEVEKAGKNRSTLLGKLQKIVEG